MTYFYELRNRLTHHTVRRQYAVGFGVGAPTTYGLNVPALGAPNTAGGGPDADE